MSFEGNEEKIKVTIIVCVFLLLIVVFMCSCTYSVNFVHSEGTTTDIIDSTNENTPTLEPILNV